VSLELDIPDDLPALIVQSTTMRQALLYIIARAANLVPRGRVKLCAESLPRRTHVRIKVNAQRADDLPPVCDDKLENLDVVRDLVHMSDGLLQVTTDRDGETPFSALVTLPAAEQVPVLVIDDNVDTLNLMRRYLSGTRYRFVGVTSPHEGQTLAERVCPAAIVLDVMLPEVDGWTVLSQLREHPATRDVPVLVCTILPHGQLAYTLGAADFLRKPVSRRELLSALARQIGRQVIGPHTSS
jgi:CheY-like chemotaxis protein